MSSVKAKNLKTRALLGAAVAATFALSACSVGQVTQTDQKVPAVPGTNAEVVNEAVGAQIDLRDMLVAYNGIEGYDQGADAALQIRLFNSGDVDDKLTAVTAEGVAQSVIVVDETVTVPTEDPTQTEDPTADPDQDPTADPDQEPDGEETPATDPTQDPEPTQDPQPTPIEFELPMNGYQILTPAEGVYLQLVGLVEPLNTGSVIEVTFHFEVAGQITVAIPMALPTSTDLPDRETAHFDDEGH